MPSTVSPHTVWTMPSLRTAHSSTSSVQHTIHDASIAKARDLEQEVIALGQEMLAVSDHCRAIQAADTTIRSWIRGGERLPDDLFRPADRDRCLALVNEHRARWPGLRQAEFDRLLAGASGRTLREQSSILIDACTVSNAASDASTLQLQRLVERFQQLFMMTSLVQNAHQEINKSISQRI